MNLQHNPLIILLELIIPHPSKRHKCMIGPEMLFKELKRVIFYSFKLFNGLFKTAQKLKCGFLNKMGRERYINQPWSRNALTCGTVYMKFVLQTMSPLMPRSKG